MKASHLFHTLFIAPAALVCTAAAQEAPAALKGMLPCDGSIIQGSVVRVVRSNEFTKLHQEAAGRFARLPKEKQEAINAVSKPTFLSDYQPDLWPDKAEYEKYAAAWKQSRMVKLTDVALGLKPIGNMKYAVLSATKVAENTTMPITIGALQYNAANNTWVSNNGELKPTPFSAGANYDYGAQTGTEWKLERKDSLSTLTETVLVSKATDGSGVYVMYNLTEKSAISGTNIANHGYMLHFPVKTASANATRPGQK